MSKCPNGFKHYMYLGVNKRKEKNRKNSMPDPSIKTKPFFFPEENARYKVK